MAAAPLSTPANPQLLTKQVQMEGMLAITIADDAASWPETLLLDVRHLLALRHDYWCLVTLASIMTTARQYIVDRGTVGDMAAMEQLSDALCACKSTPTPAFVKQNLAAMLLQTSLSEADRGTLEYLLEQRTSPADAVSLIL
jgi:hypothetical protein